MNRREFIGGLAATVVARGLADGARAVDAPRIKVGVLSDIHISNYSKPGDRGHFGSWAFKKALEYYRQNDVDAVMIVGDLTEYGTIEELKVVGRVWDEVFPGDRGRNGQEVAKIFTNGNHERFRSGENRKPEDMVRDNEKRAMKEAFGIGDFGDLMVRDVKGYTFLVSEYGHEGCLVPYLKANREKLRGSGRPFFYAQHVHLKGTNCPEVVDGGITAAALKEFPNAVAFSGHSHWSLTWEDQIWQDEFTAIGTSCLQYMSGRFKGVGGLMYDNGVSPAAGQGKHNLRLDTSGRQGMLMSVYDNRIVLERREFITDESVGPDWVIPLDGSKPYSWERRQARRATPEFEDGAVATVRLARGRGRDGDEDQLQVVFPRPRPARGDDGRTLSYEITAFHPEDGESKPLAKRVLYAQGYYLADRLLGRTGQCNFGAQDFAATGRVRFAVRACNSWGQAGQPIFGEYVYERVK